MIIGVTGHRPPKLKIDRFDGKNVYVKYRLKQLAKRYLTNYGAEVVFTGMAMGWDTAVAEACEELNIPFVACVPFEGQEARWSAADKENYHRLLGIAAEVIITESDKPKTKRYLDRNEYIVDNTELLLAMWDGEKEGGTFHCVNYAHENNKKLINLWSTWEKHKDAPFPFSNTQRVEIEFAGRTYPSVENYIQSVRIFKEEYRDPLTEMSPFEATQLNRSHPESDPAWEYIRDDVMREGLEQKFRKYPHGRKLLQSEGDELIFWNYWHETYWGKCYCRRCNGEGENKLGVLLMELRAELIAEYQ